MIRPPSSIGSVQREARARGADVWTYRYRDGKRHRNVLLGRTDVMTEQAAHKKAHRLRSQIFANRTRITIASLVDRYLAEDLPSRHSTAPAYRSMLARIRSDWGETMADDFLVDVGAIERWLRDLKTRGTKNKAAEPVSRSTQQHFKAMLHRLVECAMRWGLVDIQRNPVALAEMRGGIKRKRLPTILTVDQYLDLLKRPELGVHGRTMVVLAMSLGLRASEILGLRWEDIDLLGKLVHIQRSSVGKCQDSTKTTASEAYLPLHQNVVQVLMGWRQDAPVIEGWVFGSPITGRPYHRESLQKDYLIPAGRQIGLQRLGWHDFRHTHRAFLRDLGLPLEVQQKLMRHADISMTAKYGASPMDGAKRAGNNLLVELVAEKEEDSQRTM